MLYIVLTLILAVIAKFIYDKSQLTDHIQKVGGIKEKYKALISELSDTLSPETNEFKDHLLLKIKSDSLDIQYELIPAFDKLIIKLLLSTKNHGIVRNNWEFEESKFSQKNMANVILQYIEEALEAIMKKATIQEDELASPPTNAFESQNPRQECIEQNVNNEKVSDIISKVPKLALKDKLDMFNMIYTMCIDEEKAAILNMWNQAKHNNPFIDDLTEAFEKSNEPRFIWCPTSDDFNKNHEIIRNSIDSLKGFERIDEFIVNFINTKIALVELNRLLFITFAVFESYRTISVDLLNHCKESWNKAISKPACPYYLLLTKSHIDVLIHNQRYEEALSLAQATYVRMLDPEYQEKFHWLKYQFASVLLSLGRRGLSVSNWTTSELNDRLERHGEDAFMKDSFDSF